MDGTLVGFTADKLADAGIDLTPDQLAGFHGEWVLIASDPRPAIERRLTLATSVLGSAVRPGRRSV